MRRIVRGAFKWALVFGAFAPLICALEFLWNEQAHVLSGQSDDGNFEPYGDIIGYAVFLVLVFLALFVIGFVAGLVRGLERRR